MTLHLPDVNELPGPLPDPHWDYHTAFIVLMGLEQASHKLRASPCDTALAQLLLGVEEASQRLRASLVVEQPDFAPLREIYRGVETLQGLPSCGEALDVFSYVRTLKILAGEVEW